MRLNILDLRAGRKNIDSCLLDTILPMDNYRYARKIFIAAPAVTPELIMTVGMNRKSRTEKQNYNLPYYYLYLALERLYMNRDGSAGQEVADTLAGLNQSSIKSYENISVGLGFRFDNFYVDAAYIHTSYKYAPSQVFYFEDRADDFVIASGEIDTRQDRNTVTLSAGFKF